MAARLEQYYKETVTKELMVQFKYSSVMEVPKITKVTLNMGLGEATQNKKVLESAEAELASITGQKPVVTMARKSIAGFKVREGWPVGCKVTLRKKNMYEFFDRLVTIVIPRIRDFRGYSYKSFDGAGNYSFGITEQTVFPEIDFDKIDATRGLDICITTTAKTDEEAESLLRAFKFPLKKRREQ